MGSCWRETACRGCAVSVVFTEACIEAPQHARIRFRLVLVMDSFGPFAIASEASSDTRNVSYASSTSAHGAYINLGGISVSGGVVRAFAVDSRHASSLSAR